MGKGVGLYHWTIIGWAEDIAKSECPKRALIIIPIGAENYIVFLCPGFLILCAENHWEMLLIGRNLVGSHENAHKFHLGRNPEICFQCHSFPHSNLGISGDILLGRRVQRTRWPSRYRHTFSKMPEESVHLFQRANVSCLIKHALCIDSPFSSGHLIGADSMTFAEALVILEESSWLLSSCCCIKNWASWLIN